MLNHENMMQTCISNAQEAAKNKNYPLAACVVLNGEIIAKSSSALINSTDPTAHPEMTVIREAAEKMGSRYLEGAILYTTLEPCPMCTSAAIWAKFEGIVFGATQQDAIDWAKHNPDSLFTWRQIAITSEEVVQKGSPKLWVVGNVLREKCCALFGLV